MRIYQAENDKEKQISSSNRILRDQREDKELGEEINKKNLEVQEKWKLLKVVSEKQMKESLDRILYHTYNNCLVLANSYLSTIERKRNPSRVMKDKLISIRTVIELYAGFETNYIDQLTLAVNNMLNKKDATLQLLTDYKEKPTTQDYDIIIINILNEIIKGSPHWLRYIRYNPIAMAEYLMIMYSLGNGFMSKKVDEFLVALMELSVMIRKIRKIRKHD